MSYSIVTVPLYDTLGPDAVRYISNHAELSAVACSVAVLPMLMQSLQGCPSISLVVSSDVNLPIRLDDGITAYASKSNGPETLNRRLSWTGCVWHEEGPAAASPAIRGEG